MAFYIEHSSVYHSVYLIELKQKAELGDVSSQFQYGRFLVFHANGEPREAIVAEGARWLRAAADRLHLAAIECLAGIYMHGAPGVQANQEEGMRLTLIAEEMGSAEVVDTLAYHFAYGESPDLVKGYAYFLLQEHVVTQTGYSEEMVREKLHDLRQYMNESQVKSAEELFIRLRDSLEEKPAWRVTKYEKKRSNDKERYNRLMDMYADALLYSEYNPEELVRVKGITEKLELVMNIDDMVEIRRVRVEKGLINSPENARNKPRFLASGVGTTVMFVILLILVFIFFRACSPAK